MIGPQDASEQAAATWRMAIGADGWREALDRSLDGVFRSFWAFAYALPFALGAFYLQWKMAARTPGALSEIIAAQPLAAYLAQQIAAYLLDWGASIALIVLIARSLRAERRIADAIVGYNWLQLIATGLAVAPVGIYAVTGVAELATLSALPVIALQLVLLWGVLRRSFETTTPITIAIVIMLVLVTLTTDVVVSGVVKFAFAPAV